MKIAWFTDLSLDSVSALFSENILPIINAKHQLEIFSNLSTSFLGLKVNNYLTYDPSDFEITFFIIEDSTSAGFVYDTSLLNPGIRINIDNQFNNMMFERLGHNSNGIVYDRLLKSYGYQPKFKIGNYHMRGWSLRPYKRIFPIQYPDLGHGVDVFFGEKYKSRNSSSYYLNFPLNIKNKEKQNEELKFYTNCDALIHNENDLNFCSDLSTSNLGFYFTENNQKFLPARIISSIEELMPFVFISDNSYFNLPKINKGISQNQVTANFARLLDFKFVENLKNEIKKYSTINTYLKLYDNLIKISLENIKTLSADVAKYKILNNKKEDELIHSVSNISNSILKDFCSRYKIGE